MSAHVPLYGLRLRRPGDVVRTQAMREPLRDHPQEVVANRVSQCIVDAFELVKIEKHERERSAVTLGGFKRLSQLIVEARAVGELRNHVEISEAMDLLDRARALGRILDRSGETEDAASGAEQCFA